MTLTKQGQLGCLRSANARLFFPRATAVVGFAGKVIAAHQRCLRPFYSAVTLFYVLPVAASKNVTDFAVVVTGAAVTDNFLELANAAFFLSDSTFRSKLFIRPLNNKLSKII